MCAFCIFLYCFRWLSLNVSLAATGWMGPTCQEEDKKERVLQNCRQGGARGRPAMGRALVSDWQDADAGGAEIRDPGLDIDHGQVAQVVVPPGDIVGVYAPAPAGIRDQDIA